MGWEQSVGVLLYIWSGCTPLSSVAQSDVRCSFENIRHACISFQFIFRHVIEMPSSPNNYMVHRYFPNNFIKLNIWLKSWCSSLSNIHSHPNALLTILVSSTKLFINILVIKIEFGREKMRRGSRLFLECGKFNINASHVISW